MPEIPLARLKGAMDLPESRRDRLLQEPLPVPAAANQDADGQCNQESEEGEAGGRGSLHRASACGATPGKRRLDAGSCWSSSKVPGLWPARITPQLRYFTAVARHSSIREAADDLHIAQSALSRQIHKAGGGTWGAAATASCGVRDHDRRL